MSNSTLTSQSVAAFFLIWLLPALGLAQDEPAIDTQPSSSKERFFIKISEQDIKPTVNAIAPIDEANVFFLNKRGQPGYAKFSPGLSLIGWELYSKVKLNAPFDTLAVGPGYSLISASPNELTQCFDTSQDGRLDFFQALVRSWDGKASGVRITAGPVADEDGRLLFALSPYALEEGAPAIARIMAWHPEAEGLLTITESELPISSFAVGPENLLAARLSMPDYTEGYYLSLTTLPSFETSSADAPVETIPRTQPSLLIPAELTAKSDPSQLCFFKQSGQTKLLVSCPESRRLLEIVPTRSASKWQGAMLLRDITDSPILAMAEMGSGKLLGGGPDGFAPLDLSPEQFRINEVELAEDGIVINFSSEIDRFEGVKANSYSITSISLKGGKVEVPVEPIVESDGKTVVLKTDAIRPDTVLRIVCQNVPSAEGEALFNKTLFYTHHQK